MSKMYCITSLDDFFKVLTDEPVFLNNDYDYGVPIYYVSGENEIGDYFLFDSSVPIYRKMPSLAGSRYLFDMQLLEAIANKYIPIFDKSSKKLLFTEEEFLNFRKKMSGLNAYDAGEFIFSENLVFPGIEEYLELIEQNFEDVKKHRDLVLKEVISVLENIGLTVGVGVGDKDVEIIETGSTARGTNVPSKDFDVKWDFDFTVRISPEHLYRVKNALHDDLRVVNSATDHLFAARDKVRLTNVIIPGLEKNVDLDFSISPQKKEYLSTDGALFDRLEQIKKQDEYKYKLILANIMYAKNYLKKSGAYKPARGIVGDRSFGGLGGVGIENLILQNGGSFIDAATDFLTHAQGKEFVDFEKEYAVMDFGKDHVSVTKGDFPYHNFVMRNMRENGYLLMQKCLLEFLEKVRDVNKEETKMKK